MPKICCRLLICKSLSNISARAIFLSQVTSPEELLADYLRIRLVGEAQQVSSLVTLAGNDLDAAVVDPQIAIYYDREGGV